MGDLQHCTGFAWSWKLLRNWLTVWCIGMLVKDPDLIRLWLVGGLKLEVHIDFAIMPPLNCSILIHIIVGLQRPSWASNQLIRTTLISGLMGRNQFGQKEQYYLVELYNLMKRMFHTIHRRKHASSREGKPHWCSRMIPIWIMRQKRKLKQMPGYYGGNLEEDAERGP